MQPVPQVSPDGKYRWDGQSWQALPTVPAASDVYVAGAAVRVRRGQVAGAVALWAVLVIGIGTIALGAIVLGDLLNPHHPKSDTASSGVFLLAVGALVVLPAMVPSRWLTRHASPGWVEMSWGLWLLWAVLVLGIGIAALGMIGLLDLLNPNHSISLTAAPSSFVMGLGGLAILGPTLKLLWFGLSITRRTQAPRSAKLSRPLASSERARMGIEISGMVLVVVGALAVTVSKVGVGWALVIALASGIVFGVAANLGWAWLRRQASQEPVPFVPAPSSTSTGSAVRPVPTLRATASARWVTLVLCLVLAGGLIGIGIRGWIVHGHVDLLWPQLVIAALFVAIAYSYWSMYIQADDTAIVFRFVVTRRYLRREVVAIRIGRFVVSYYTGSGRRVSFLRPDGSVMFTTIFYWWGKDELEALATYLGIPIHVAN